ncbi:MAG: hypothetical protein CMO80_16440 [Verrucomicrobiales bacterium]|nr:hypothetical protein [Verrucomicrobiales bacterium]|tara:strand:- start:4662 stop:5663 length:1002 start_codon:yes stop_codon:yes gene_type:complete
MKSISRNFKMTLSKQLFFSLTAAVVTSVSSNLHSAEDAGSRDAWQDAMGQWLRYTGGGYWIKRISHDREILEIYTMDGIRRNAATNPITWKVSGGILHFFKENHQGSRVYEGIYKPQGGKLYEFNRGIFAETFGRPQVWEYRNPSSTMETWFHAVRTGDIKQLKAALKKGFDVNQEAPGAYNGMAMAAASGQLESIRFLKEQGADPATPSAWWRTRPLIEAAHFGQLEAAKLLLGMGADIDGRNGFGWSPLHEAAKHGRPLVADLLLREGANINALNNSGNAPLHIAIESRRLSLAKWLLKEGANLGIRNKKGQTAKDIAKENGMLRALNQLQ